MVVSPSTSTTQSQTKTRDDISNHNSDTKTPNSDSEKAEVLLNQFSSMFTKETEGEIPKFCKFNTPHNIQVLVITG